MSILLPNAYGVVFRVSERTLTAINREREHLLAMARGLVAAGVDESDVADVFNEDEDLFGVTVAANPMDMEEAVRELEAAGLVSGVDFVVTHGGRGVPDPRPAWLMQLCANEDGLIRLQSAVR